MPWKKTTRPDASTTKGDLALYAFPEVVAPAGCTAVTPNMAANTRNPVNAGAIRRRTGGRPRPRVVICESLPFRQGACALGSLNDRPSGPRAAPEAYPPL